ncbi:MAG: DUF3943 domain-containing protein [Chitinophagaceae bacterium]|nr:DUF3943 domain-containing protein [Chitinophagaceae bacterium]
MKLLSLLPLLCFSFVYGKAQTVERDTIIRDSGNVNRQLKEIKKEKAAQFSDSAAHAPSRKGLDSSLYNSYGDLLNDDPVYNPKAPVWKPLFGVIRSDLSTFLMDRYVLKYDFSQKVGFSSWAYNIKNGWEWDRDRFGVNFIGHPYSGTLSFNAARTSGYTYLQSFPFAVAGSLIWEYFGETTKPSYNDLINTSINGSFLGEVLYRLSSNILDDRSTGAQRFFRELFAGIINPERGFSRLMSGKTHRHTDKEIYQKDRLNIALYAGAMHFNAYPIDPYFKTAPTDGILNVQLDYGNPFESRHRKPFDLFRLRVDFSFGVGRKILDNINGYGILLGKNFETNSGKAALLGLFQYYDYWDNSTFELGSLGFGAGVITRLPLSQKSKSNLYTAFHVALVPFAGASTRFGPDSSQLRDYSFGGGLESKLEISGNIGNVATATLVAYHYWLHTYEGLKENNSIAILKPRFTFHLVGNLSIGYEHALYYNDVHSTGLPDAHLTRNEQKVFLMLYLEDRQRRGHYN